MATASNESSLTDRSGWRDRTLLARSCTQMDIDIRWAILTSKVKNSNIPEVCLTLSPLSFTEPSSVPRYILASSAHTDLTDEGMAVRTTEIDSTMPMSSSSERSAAFAASSSSEAMPKDTDRARSEPREPRAPVAALMPHSSLAVATSEVKLLSQEGDVVRRVLAWQEDVGLSIRHLLTSPILDSRTPGRGGKASRQRVGGSHVHNCAGRVFGCTLGNAVHYARGSKYRVCDAMRVMRRSLEPASRELMSCSGEDVQHLQMGFACYSAIRGQLSLLPEYKAAPRIDEKHGKKSVVLGISVCMFFVLSLAIGDANDSGAARQFAYYISTRCMRILEAWRSRMGGVDERAKAALGAEKRALRRGVLALQVARSEASRLSLNSYNAVRLELAFMRKAMFPSKWVVCRDTQAELCDWIHSQAFLTGATIPAVKRPDFVPCLNVPLSALPEIPERSSGGSDGGSVCDSGSSSLSLSSMSSADGSESGHTDAMDTLASTLAEKGGCRSAWLPYSNAYCI